MSGFRDTGPVDDETLDDMSVADLQWLEAELEEQIEVEEAALRLIEAELAELQAERERLLNDMGDGE